MTSLEHAQNAVAHDHFLVEHTIVLDQFFTSDQARSLQDLLSAHHAHLFRYVYEMETHLEMSLEELKNRQYKRDKEIAKMNLLVENTRCNVLALAKKLDGAVPFYSGKTTAQNVHDAPRRDSHMWNSDYTDSSTLSSSSGQIQPRTRKPSPSFPQSSASPGLHIGNEAAAFHTTASTVRNFGTLPNVSGTITSATWSISNNGPYLSPESDDSSMQSSSPGPSNPHIPSVSNPVDVDMNGHAAFDIVPEDGDSSYDQNSEDEEIVAMQLFINDSPSTPALPSSPSSPDFEMEMSTCNDTPRAHISHLPSQSKICPSSHSHPTPTPPSPPLSPTPLPSRGYSLARTPAPIHDQVLCQPETQPQTNAKEQIHTGPKSICLTSVPHPQIPFEVQGQDFFDDLTRELSPLSLLTESSVSTETAAGVGTATGNTPSYGDENSDANEEDGLGSRLDPLSMLIVQRQKWEEATVNPTSISAVTAKQLKLEQRRERKRFMERERRRKKREALQDGLLAKMAAARSKAKSRVEMARLKENRNFLENGTTRRTRNNMRGAKRRRIIWPKMYKGHDEDDFYRKLIECDLCSCWYHYGCAGITPGDVRLQSTEIYICPVCITNGENKIKNKLICSRPRCCRNEVTQGEYFVAGIAGRKLRYGRGGGIKVLYLIEWDGYPVHDATWEFIEAIPEPQRLIEEFEEACRRQDLKLDTHAPVLLKEAVEAGWEYVLAYTDPPGVKVPLEGLPGPEHLGDQVVVNGFSPPHKVESP